MDPPAGGEGPDRAHAPARPRRLRTPALRSLVRETALSPDHLVQPVFVDATLDAPRDLPGLPAGQRAHPVDGLDEPVQAALDGGVRTVLLFGVPGSKDPEASRAYADKGVVQRAVGAIRETFGDAVTVATDVCLCQYTDHGHCGVVRGGRVVNDETLPLLARTAVTHADAGADVVAPSAMMDRQVHALRSALDEAGHGDVAILSYAVKYASAFYGPFREAARSAPSSGDRSGYQMDPANAAEARREARLDVAEGADIVMVKPGLPYLDVVRALADDPRIDVPLAAYQVSGEAAMIEAAAAKGWLDRDRAVVEALTALRRAGARVVVSYYASEFGDLAARVRSGEA